MTAEIFVTHSIELKSGSPLRRYMDLPKFVDLLRSNLLYLSRADCFDDRFEGALTPSIRKAIDSAKIGEHIESADMFYQRSRKGTFVSCWTFGAKDNMAIWQLFGGASNSVAITTTVERLVRMCIRWPDRVHIAKVRYIDHFEDPDMVISRYQDPLEFKHEAFDFEREVRVMLSMQENWQHNPKGIRRAVSDINDLITSVVIAPNSETWFLELVQDVVQRYGLKVPVRMSQLAALPT
jgi:hypothetical protein